MVTDVIDDTSDQPAIVVEDCAITIEMKVILEKNKKIMRTLSLSNEPLSLVVNGAPSEPICMSPFFSIFTK